MTLTFSFYAFLLFLGLVCFFLALFPKPPLSKVNWIAAGLLFVTLAWFLASINAIKS